MVFRPANLCRWKYPVLRNVRCPKGQYDTIDLNDFGNEKLPKKIAARIYKTRNALVHHKSNNARVKERGVYHPFNDDDELAQEMPLMRLIAEAIIIRSAEEI